MRRENPEAFEQDMRSKLAQLFASASEFRGGGLFQMRLMEAEAKLAAGQELDELDRTVLAPPHEDDVDG